MCEHIYLLVLTISVYPHCVEYHGPFYALLKNSTLGHFTIAKSACNLSQALISLNLELGENRGRFAIDNIIMDRHTTANGAHPHSYDIDRTCYLSNPSLPASFLPPKRTYIYMYLSEGCKKNASSG